MTATPKETAERIVRELAEYNRAANFGTIPEWCSAEHQDEVFTCRECMVAAIERVIVDAQEEILDLLGKKGATTLEEK